MTVELIRHGNTLWQGTGRYQGKSDVPLSAAGLAPITGAGTGAGGLAAEHITSGECLAAAAVPEAAREALRTRPEPKAAFAAAFAG